MRRHGRRYRCGVAGRAVATLSVGWRRCSRAFSPRCSRMLVALLVGVVWTRGIIDIEREVLILFDGAPGRGAGSAGYPISRATRWPSRGCFDWIQLVLVGGAWRWTYSPSQHRQPFDRVRVQREQDRRNRPEPHLAGQLDVVGAPATGFFMAARFRARRAMADALPARLRGVGCRRRCRVPAVVRLRLTFDAAAFGTVAPWRRLMPRTPTALAQNAADAGALHDAAGPSDSPSPPTSTMPPQRRTIFTWRRLIELIVELVAIYALWPWLVAVYSSLGELSSIDPAWFVAMIALEIASFACLWVLIAIPLRSTRWFLIGTSQIVGYAVGLVLPVATPQGPRRRSTCSRTGGSTCRAPPQGSWQRV